MKRVYFSIIGLALLMLTSCNILEPLDDTHDTPERLTENVYAEGILLNGYIMMPTGKTWSFNDVATDDAVSNNSDNQFKLMAAGSWSPTFTPTGQWTTSMRAVNYENQFLYTIIDNVKWGKNDATNRLFLGRLRGEAYALRGIHRFYALQDVAGKVEGKLQGIQIVNGYLDENSDYNIPRETFENSIKAIYADLDSAAYYLPTIYGNISDLSKIPALYSGVSVADYNTVMGDLFRQRIQKRIVLAYKAKVALFAASKAYNPDGQNAGDPTWLTAAQFSAAALQDIVLNSTGHRYYEGSIVNATPVIENNNNEMCWRTYSTDASNTLEKRIFPPSLNGNGEINPTQNFVDAFPMADGFPYGDPRSIYAVDPNDPYKNRDPRLALYVIRNGTVYKTTTIYTGAGGGLNAKDSVSLSTKTGYYLKKLVRDDVTFNNDGTSSTQRHYWVYVRFTEIFLAYAEAANEYGGPDYIVPGYNKNARNVIGDIRKRAGITQPDKYLQSITSREDMRELIRNERRIELSFEGFRFYDLRRWDLPINEPAKGVQVTGTVGNFTYNYINVEPRVFEPYMIYGPLPEQDVLRFPALKQNDGWK